LIMSSVIARTINPSNVIFFASGMIALSDISTPPE
jgi:hypothetical protein